MATHYDHQRGRHIRVDPPADVSVPMNGSLRAASVEGLDYGHPIIVVAHADTPAEWLIERARAIRAQSRFAAGGDLEWDPA